MKKKIIALGLAVAMLAVAAIGSTLAYFTDTDKATNVFTIGNIDIELTEKVAVIDSDGNDVSASRVAVYENGAVYNNIMPGNKLVKTPTITNVGNNPAYVRVVVVVNNGNKINDAIDEYYEDLFETDNVFKAEVENFTYEDAYGNQIVGIDAYVSKMYDTVFDGWNMIYVHNNKYGYDMRNTIAENKYDASKVLKIDATERIDEYCQVSLGNAFRDPVGDPVNGYGTAHVQPSTLASYYTKDFLNEYEICYAYYLDLDAGESVTLFNGLYAPAEFNNAQMKMFENLKIEIYADAIQKEGFATGGYKTAINALQDTHPLSSLRVATDFGEQLVNDAEILKEALQNGEDVVLGGDVTTTADITAPYGNKTGYVQKGGVFDGNGNTLTIAEPSGSHYGIMTYGGTIKNVDIGGVFRGIVLYSPTEDVIIDNVTIKDDDVCYAINTAEHPNVDGIDLIVSNSTICGWTSFAGLESASFTNCTFGQGTYYNNDNGRLVKPYITTTFTECDFGANYYLDLSALGANCTVTLTNCTVNNAKLTADTYMTGNDDPNVRNGRLFIELPAGRTLEDCVIFS